MPQLRLLIGGSADNDSGQYKFIETEKACSDWQISYLKTGKELLGRLEFEDCPDAVILFACLEDPDFYQTTLGLRSIVPDLPVIVISDHISNNIIRLAAMAGGIELLGWPAETEVLQTLVNKLVKQRITKKITA